MRSDLIANLLGQTQLFGGLSDEMLARVAERCLARRYNKGNIVFRRGDAGDRLYVIAEGAVKVVLTSDDGDEMLLRTMEKPEVLGELALADGGPRSAGVEVVEDSLLVSLDRETWLDLQEANPELRQAMLDALVAGETDGALLADLARGEGVGAARGRARTGGPRRGRTRPAAHPE